MSPCLCFAPSGKGPQLGLQQLSELLALQGPRHYQSKLKVEVCAEGAVESRKSCSPIFSRKGSVQVARKSLAGGEDHPRLYAK